jgi:hypothetical protein
MGEKPDEEEVSKNICTKSEIKFLGGELVYWRDHHSGVCDQHIRLGLLPTIRKSVKLPRGGRKGETY